MDNLIEPPRRFPLPWVVCHNDDSYWVEDATGQKFAFTYFRDSPIVGTDTSVRVTRDEARRIATNIAKLPDQQLAPDIREALRKFIASRDEELTEAEAVRMLLRDALIGIGDLPLSSANRSRHAGRKV
jgi:hypothetical protein